ncbi:MAG: PLP-dependent aminotransferase family protein [Candidatus Aminicenantales bacterium]
MNISIDKESSTPVYLQIKEKIKELIADRTLRNRDPLPPTRALSEKLGVHRNTIISAYKTLEAEGYAYSHVGRGTFIVAPEKTSVDDRIAFHNMFDWSQQISDKLKLRISPKLLALYQTNMSKAAISFVWNQRSLLDFPAQKIQRAMNSVLRNKRNSIFNYSDPMGDFDLRLIISNRMRIKGIRVLPENILVVSGAQQGIDLLARLFLEPGDTVVVENPTYTGALSSFQFLQARIIGIPVDEWGMKVDLLEEIIKKYHPKFIFTNPTFHNPTGTTMRKDRREQLVSVALKYRIPVIEDDYASELRYSGLEAPALKALNSSDQVIYVGTFSKVLIPGLRVGWIAASQDIVGPLSELKRLSDLCTSPFTQSVIAEFHERGYMASHLRFLKRQYLRRLQVIIKAVRQYFPPETIFYRPEGGIYLWVILPEPIDLEELLERSQKRGVTFSPGHLFYLDDQGHDRMRLQFSLEDEESIERGLKIIGEEIARQSVP